MIWQAIDEALIDAFLSGSGEAQIVMNAYNVIRVKFRKASSPGMRQASEDN